MEIDGPLIISVVENDTTGARELQLNFKPDFCALDRDMRVVLFQKYIADLGKRISLIEEGPDRQGMLTIQQLAEQLLPYLTSDEIPLEETIVVELHTGSPPGGLLQSL
ncbi:MAG: transcriptional regulator [Gammaproteobacteria bacterium]|nr:MAG: transcriptional regulator [Gammaproteobacteria bacterium]